MFSNSYVVADAGRRLHRRLLVDPHRPQLHRHGAHAARAGHDAGSGCRSSSGRSTRPASSWCWRRRCSRSRCCWWSPSGCSRSASSIRRSAAIRCSSSTCSGSTRTRPSTSWCCRRWAWSARSSRASRGSASSATASWPTRSSASPSSASSSGATTCSSAASRCTRELVFSLLSFIVAVPSAIKVFNWTATLYKGSIRFDAPMLYALGFVGLFTIGGLTGLFLAALAARRAPARHLLRRRALPLHHGRRLGDGVPRRRSTSGGRR